MKKRFLLRDFEYEVLPTTMAKYQVFRLEEQLQHVKKNRIMAN
jgi:hypothetical protein